jgi:hypothetical protein
MRIAGGAAIATGMLLLAGCTRSAASSREIALALSAAPAAIASGAAVVKMDDHGATSVLRQGTNGWTCMPTDPGTPISHPVCVDRNGLEWFRAVMAGQLPDASKTGYSYMLDGGSAWSTTDPAATSLAAGETAPIVLPPHIMILNARIAEDSGFPSGEARPDARKPFVMYGGTPWAILIIPVH